MLSPTDPFRFDDRTGHYGSGQADLAPVSPLAAPPREIDEVRPLDPMGASPSGRQTDERLEREGLSDRAETQSDARSDSQVSTASEPGATSAQAAAGLTTTATVYTQMREGPVREEAAPQTVLPQSQADIWVETDLRADAADIPVMSSGTPVDLLPESGPGAAESAGDFAEMATRMDQMMAEMTARMESLSPRSVSDQDDNEIGPGPLADAQDRLDDLFGSLGDRFGVGADADDDAGSDLFGVARDRLDDLAGGLELRGGDAANDSPTPLADAAGRLDDLKAGLGRADGDAPDASTPSPDLGGSLLARLFDGDAVPDEDRMADLLGGMDDLSFAPPTVGFDPGRWDDLPDLG